MFFYVLNSAGCEIRFLVHILRYSQTSNLKPDVRRPVFS